MEERGLEASLKAKEEEERLREEERIREEASRLLEKERQSQEQQRRLREEEHAREYRLARDAEIRAKKEEEQKRSGESVEEKHNSDIPRDTSTPVKDQIPPLTRGRTPKVLTYWQSRETEAESLKPIPEKNTLNIPQTTGASKVAAMWEQKLNQPAEEPKIVRGQPPTPRDPNKVIGKIWETQVGAQPSTSKPNGSVQKDIEDLKAIMAKEDFSF